MFRKIRNTLLTSALALSGFITFWDLVESGNSLLLFGEPEYPSEI